MIKKIFVSLLATAVLVALLDLAIGSTLRHFYFTQSSGFQYRTTYSIDKTRAQILVFGSSRANHHYVPEVFEGALGRTFYNAGRDGQGILFHTALLKSIAKRYAPQIVILEYDGDFEYREGGYDKLAALLPYYRDHAELRSIVELKGPFEKIKLLSQIYPFNSEALSIAVGNSEFNKQRNADHQGYSPLFGAWSEPIQFAEANPASRVDANKVAAFRDFIATAKAVGARVYVVNSPIYLRFHGAEERNIAKEICAEAGVDFLDYSRDQRFTADASLFKDISHLNNTGATRFSELAAGYILRHDQGRGPSVSAAGAAQ